MGSKLPMARGARERLVATTPTYTRTVKWLDPARKPFIAALILGAVFAVVFGLAYPPFDLWGLALVAPLPLILIAQRTRGSWRSAVAVALASSPMWWWHHDWIGDITGAGMPALVVYLCCWTGLFILVGSRISKRWPNLPAWIWAPVAWTAIELLRGEVVMHGYSWFMVGEPLLLASPWVVLGMYTTGFLVVVWNGSLSDLVNRWGRTGCMCVVHAGVVVSSSVLVVLGAQMLLEKRAGSGQTVRIGIVQTDVPQSNKVNWEIEDRVRDLEHFLAMTREVAAMTPPPDIIVWPETMFPGDTLSPDVVAQQRDAGLAYASLGLPATYFHDQLMEVQRELGIPMIVGAIARDGYHLDIKPSGGAEMHTDAIYNSAFVVVDGEVQPGRYDKEFLTPFGEVMPYISAWPWLEQKLLALGATGLTFELSAGTNQKPLVVPLRDGRTIRVAPQICFEATMPSPVRHLVFEHGKRRADVIVQITNDGWFGDFTPGKEHHMLLAQWRAAELGTPAVRIANTGISGSIDARGRDITGVPLEDRNLCEWTHVFTVALPDPDSVTLFARGGWAAAWLAMPVCLVLLIWPRKRNRTEGPSPASEGS